MPVRRRGRRYLMVQVAGAKRFTAKEVADAVQKGVHNLYGVWGTSQIEPMLINFDEEDQRGILRCNRAHLRKMRASLTLITDIADSAAAIHVGKVSGTIKALKTS